MSTKLTKFWLRSILWIVKNTLHCWFSQLKVPVGQRRLLFAAQSGVGKVTVEILEMSEMYFRPNNDILILFSPVCRSTRRGDPRRFQEISFPERMAGASLAPMTRRTSVLEECCPSPTGCLSASSCLVSRLMCGVLVTSSRLSELSDGPGMWRRRCKFHFLLQGATWERWQYNG